MASPAFLDSSKHSFPFLFPSSAVPMMMIGSTDRRQVNITDHRVYVTFTPFDIPSKKKRGVYPENPLGLDEMRNPDPEAMLYFRNDQLMKILLADRSIGTPAVVLNELRGDFKPTEIDKKLKNDDIYINKNASAGSPYFQASVTERICQIKGIPLQMPSFEPKPSSLGLDENTKKAYIACNSPLLKLNTMLGYFGSDARTKFDIICMPMYLEPTKANYDDRQIFGFMNFYICYDPRWNPRDAYHKFIKEYLEFLSPHSNKSKVKFDCDPSMLKYFDGNQHEKFYSSHFTEWISVNANLVREVSIEGIDLNPDNQYGMDRFLDYRNALDHAIKYAGIDVNRRASWDQFYRSICDTRFGYLTFTSQHDAYLYNYGEYTFNSNFELIRNSLDDSAKSGRGIFFEMFPWITRYYLRTGENPRLRGLEFAPTSMLPPSVRPLEDSFEKNKYTNPHDRSVLDAITAANTDTTDTFIHSDHNALVKVAEQARSDLQYCAKLIETFRSQHPEMDTLLFPQSTKGYQAYTPEQVKKLNTLLDELEVLNKHLRGIQNNLLYFAKKRIFTLATVKPLTSSVLSLIQYLEGRTLTTERPGAGQSTLDIADAKPITSRNISQYRLEVFDPSLDITATAASYMVTCFRLYLMNATCVHDLLKVRIGLSDAFRSEFNMHWNFGSFGPFGTSKSHVLDQFKELCVPHTCTTITSSTVNSDSSSKDMSDQIRLVDEASMLLSTNAKGPNASYSVDASVIKTQLTTGMSIRTVLDPGKSYKERITRAIVTILMISWAVTGNLIMTDKGLKSRFHTTFTEGENLQKKRKKEMNAMQSASSTGEITPEQHMERQEKDRNRIGMHDIVLYRPTDAVRKIADHFRESMIMEHAMTILVWKYIQMGILKKPSEHLVCVVAVMCKFLKATLNISIEVRTVQRIMLFASNLAIVNGINTLFNTPNIHEELHTKFSFDSLMAIRPYLHCTLQMIMLSFSMHAPEFLTQTDNTLLEVVLEQYETKGFPLQRIAELFRWRHIKRTHQDNPMYAQLNKVPTEVTRGADPEIMKDPLWPAFRDEKTIPLEYLYYEEETSEKSINKLYWRIIEPPNTGEVHANMNKPAKMNFQPQQQPQQQAQVGPHTDVNSALSGRASVSVDLNFWVIPYNKVQLLEILSHKLGEQLIGDQIRSAWQTLENTKFMVRTSNPTPKKVLAEYAAEKKLLPRVNREVNCIEYDDKQNVCVCVHAFSEILNRPANNNVILQALKSFLYKGMDERTLLTGSEMSETYDIRFDFHPIRKEDMHMSLDYLQVTDPSMIQKVMDDKNHEVVQKITRSMKEQAIATTKIANRLNEGVRSGALNANAAHDAEELTARNRKARMNEAFANDSMDQQAFHDILNAAPNMSSQQADTRPLDHSGGSRHEPIEIASQQQSNPPFILDSPEKPTKNTPSGQERIYQDIEEWDCIKHHLDHALPLRLVNVNENTPGKNPQYVMMTKMYPDNPSSKWEPLRTPQRLIRLRSPKSEEDAMVIESLINESSQTSDSGGFGSFYQQLTSQRSTNPIVTEQIPDSQPDSHPHRHVHEKTPKHQHKRKHHSTNKRKREDSTHATNSNEGDTDNPQRPTKKSKSGSQPTPTTMLMRAVHSNALAEPQISADEMDALMEAMEQQELAMVMEEEREEEERQQQQSTQ